MAGFRFRRRSDRRSRRRPETPRRAERRTRFHRDLAALEEQVQDMGRRARRALDTSVRALATADLDLARAVIDGDDDIDRRYREIEQRAVELVGLQQPVATDLRLLVAVLHVALHLERIGDMAVNVAEATREAAELPAIPEVLQRLQEMGGAAALMAELAVDAFIRRDRDACERLPLLDDRVDRFDRQMVGYILEHRDGADGLEWAMRMLPVSRSLERAADHAVDIAEQAWYVVTGEMRELD